MRLKKFNEMASNLEVTDSMTRQWISDKEFKKIHIKHLGNILYQVYKPIGHWKKHKFFGVMDLAWDDERWSLLNRINTNYTALSIMINSINDVLERGKSDIPKFDLVSNKFGTEEFYAEYDRMMDFVTRNGKHIFLKTTEEDGSTVINNIVNAIRNTRKMGDDAEKVVVEYLPKLNPEITNIKLPEGSGDANDMIGGADVFFDFNGRTYTIQVKKVRGLYLNKEDGTFSTRGASISKHYKTSYYAILNDKFLTFFKNDPTKITLVEGELLIDDSLKVKAFKYK